MEDLFTVEDFRKAARRVLDPVAYDYYASGADGQRLRRLNRRAWDDVPLRPRVMVDVSSVDTSTTVAGVSLAWPAMVAPMAYQKLAHPDGELATANACAAAQTPMIVSTMANVTLEDVAAATPAPKWFQLYCHRDRGITQALVERAEAAGYGALVITVDAPVLGRRVPDERNRFALPPGITRANLEGEAAGAAGDASELAALFRNRQDAALNWRDLEWFRGLTRLPLWLKGVLRADDAQRAADAGCAGVIVSNHGGRQLDAAIPTAHALPAIAGAVGARMGVLVDGGIHWGADIVRALALGAHGVLLGRPVLWGLAVGGEAGVRRVLELLRGDFTRAMQLTGCASVSAANRELLA